MKRLSASSPLIRLTRTGRKPAVARVPGLDATGILRGRLGPGRYKWQFCCHGLLAN